MIDLPFFRDLMTARWCGIPFGVQESRGKGGRKLAMHQYPYRDIAWAEDMGRRPRSIHMTGFLVEGGGAYGGHPSVITQRNQMLAACETEAEGELVHPTFGVVSNMSLLEFEFRESRDEGGVVEVVFSFVESSPRPYPEVWIDTEAQTLMSAIEAAEATVRAYVQAVNDGLLAVHGLLRDALSAAESTSNFWATEVRFLSTTSTSLLTMASGLPGALGRFSGATFSRKKKLGNTIDGLIGSGAAARTHVQSALSGLLGAVKNLNHPGIARSALTVADALLSANPDPRHAILTLKSLGNLPATPQPTPAGKIMNEIMSKLFRRAAIQALARASIDYQPTSYDDADEVRGIIVNAIDDEMLVAGDASEDDIYNALRNLKTSAVRDLTRRGASLLHMIEVITPQPMSSLVLAQRQYQNGARESELVKEADPIHPMAMPIRFMALSA